MENVLAEWGAVAVSPMELYRDMFHLGDGCIQRDGEPSGSFKTNPIIIGKPVGSERVCRRIMFEDTFEELLSEFQDYEWAFLNGLTYWGRVNSAANQSKMYAMIFDLDGVTPDTLHAFFSGAMKAKAYPVPNYVTLSGHGVHLYYVFEQPIDLYPNVKTQLKELKYALTDKMWNTYTSTEERVQHQGINQGFRIVGGKTKIDGVRVRAFKVSDHPIWLDYLNEFVPDDKRIDDAALWRESKLTLAEAAEKWPEWYERRVLRKESPGVWHCKEDLYRWWIRQIKSGATYGHRYFCIMCLAIYAVKCGIGKDELERDAYGLIPFLNKLNPKEPFTETDVKSALECFDERYIRFPRDDVSRVSGIPIKANKRNHRPQAQHMAVMRAIQNVTDPDGNWRNKKGAPTKRDLIREYAYEHPGSTQREIAAAVGATQATVSKWLKGDWKAEWEAVNHDTQGLPAGVWRGKDGHLHVRLMSEELSTAIMAAAAEDEGRGEADDD